VIPNFLKVRQTASCLTLRSFTTAIVDDEKIGNFFSSSTIAVKGDYYLFLMDRMQNLQILQSIQQK
jgi:hypothetical protein